MALIRCRKTHRHGKECHEGRVWVILTVPGNSRPHTLRTGGGGGKPGTGWTSLGLASVNDLSGFWDVGAIPGVWGD